jgi:hypothetical protein
MQEALNAHALRPVRTLASSSLRMFYSENRCPPRIEFRGKLFPEHALAIT